MDLGFFRRGRSAAAGLPLARMDHGMLTAALEACQPAGTPARSEGDMASPPGGPASNMPLVELLTGGPEWKEAVARQGGSFNPTCARSRGHED